MQLNCQLLQHNTNWQKAKHLSYWPSQLIPYKESFPPDFLHDKDEVSDTVLDNYNEFKKWIKSAEEVGISEKTLMVLCKNVDNLQSVFRLKAFEHIFYPNWLKALHLYYLDNAISKIELQNTFVEYSLFSGKPKPVNLAELRKTVLEIHKNILQTANKQICRNVKKQCSKKIDIFVI